MSINRAIFRAYDIRANTLKDLTPYLAYQIGYAFGKNITRRIEKGLNVQNRLLKQMKVCVGFDGRLSSPALYYALCRGLLGSDVQVISIGLVPTPTLYFADLFYQADASIMVTGSHNPKDDNGFKMVFKHLPFAGDDISGLYDYIIDLDWMLSGRVVIESNDPDILSQQLLKETRRFEIMDINNEYVAKILDDITIKPDLKVAIDPGNGASGKIIELLAQKLPCQTVVINSAIDGNFPNHHPDPTVLKNLQQLIEIVKSQNCHLGIAFDGDGDRIGVVDSKGNMIFADQILCLFIKDVLLNNPGASIIADVKTSMTVFEQIEKYGGTAIMSKTGHSFIKARIKESGASLAGEMSGHMFFADRYYGYDDAIYTALRLLELLSKSSNSLEEMLAELPQTYATPEIRLPIKEEQKPLIIPEIQRTMKSQNANFIAIDGIRFVTKDGWWLLRNSNTEPVIIARCEALTPEALERLKEELNAILAPYNLELPSE